MHLCMCLFVEPVLPVAMVTSGTHRGHCGMPNGDILHTGVTEWFIKNTQHINHKLSVWLIGYPSVTLSIFLLFVEINYRLEFFCFLHIFYSVAVDFMILCNLNLLSLYSSGRKEMFYLMTHSTHFIYGYMASDMVKDHSDSERGNPLPPHGLLFLAISKGSFICIIP